MYLRISALLAVALIGGCHVSGEGNDAPRCNAELSCPVDLVCYRGFCVTGDEDGGVLDGEELDEPDAGSDDAAVSDAATTDGLTVTDAAATSPAPVADAGAAVATPEAGTGAQPTAPADAAAPPPPSTGPATMPPAVADAGSAAPPGSSLPWPLDVPVNALICLAPCSNVFDPKPCRDCVQKTLKLDPEVLCGASKGRDDDDDDDYDEGTASIDPGFLGLRSAVCTTLCLGAARGQGHCKGGK